jgi:hypothetical protein
MESNNMFEAASCLTILPLVSQSHSNSNIFVLKKQHSYNTNAYQMLPTELIVCFWQIGGWCTAGTAPSPYDCESK